MPTRKIAAVLAGMFICLGATRGSNPPSGQEVIEKFVEVTGGRQAYAKLKTRVSTGTFTLPQQNLTGPITLYQKAPDQVLITGEIAGVSYTRGFNGEVAFETNSAIGARVIDGDEREAVRQTALLDPLHRLKELYPQIANLGVEQVNDRDAYKIELTSASGQKLTEWFDLESGLLIQLHMQIDSLLGPLEVLATMEDWRETDGVMVPFRTTQRIDPLGMEQVIEFTKVQTNADIPASKFELPQSVRDVLAESGATPPATQPTDARR
jgi:hypothetical protein